MNSLLWFANFNDKLSLLPNNLTSSIADSFTVYSEEDEKEEENFSESREKPFNVLWINDGCVNELKHTPPTNEDEKREKSYFWSIFSPLSSFQVTSVHCNYNIFGIITNNCQVFMWGASDRGQCGCIERYVYRPKLVVVKTKDTTCCHGVHESGGNIPMEQLNFGRSLALGISSDGSLWSWGTVYPPGDDLATDPNGCLATTTNAILEPYQVQLNRKVITVSCGEYHYLALVESAAPPSGGEFTSSPRNLHTPGTSPNDDHSPSSLLDSCAKCKEQKEKYFTSVAMATNNRHDSSFNRQFTVTSSNFDDFSPYVCPLGLKLEFSDQILDQHQTSSPIRTNDNHDSQQRLLRNFSTTPNRRTNGVVLDHRNYQRRKSSATLPASAFFDDVIAASSASMEMVEMRKTKSAGNRFSFISFDYNGTDSSSSSETLSAADVVILNKNLHKSAADTSSPSKNRDDDLMMTHLNRGANLKKQNSNIAGRLQQQNFVDATEVWSWGSNDFGQLGLGDFIKRSQPCRIDKLCDSFVSKLDAGGYHSGALTSAGEVFVWGSNLNGQIKQTTNARSSPEFFKIGSQSSVLDVACGRDFTVLLVNNLDWKPEVYYCGRNYIDDQSIVDRLSVWTKSYNGWPISIRCFDTYTILPIVLYQHDNEQQVLCKLYELLFTEIKFVQKMKQFHRFVDELHSKHFLNDSPTENELLEDYAHGLGQFCSLVVKSVNVMKQCLTIMSSQTAGISKIFSTCSLFLSVPSSDDFSVSLKNLHTLYCQMVATNVFNFFKLNDDLENQLRQLASLNDIESSRDTRLLKKLFCLPFNRIKEYADLAHAISRTDSIICEDKEWLMDFVKHMKVFEQFLCNVLVQSEKTHHFWTKYSCKSHLLALKKIDRYLVKEYPRQSGINAISESGSSVAFQEVFVFNDSLTITLKNSVKIFDFPLLWLVPIHDDSKFTIQVLLPEITLSIDFTDGVAKNDFVQCIVQSLMRYLNGPYSETYPGNGPPLRRKGRFVFSTKHSTFSNATYTGYWVLGKPHGIGHLIYSDGRQFQGRFKDGSMHGYGEMRSGTESENCYPIIRGYWKESCLTGLAIVNYGNGSRYEGYLKNGLRHGHGVLSRRSQTYFGAWENDKRCGYGVADRGKEKYLGMWENDKEQGCGCLVTLDAIYYEGTFDAGVFVKGRMIIQDGTKYEGEFNGVGHLNGKASIFFLNGDKVSGLLTGHVTDGVKINHGEYVRHNESPNNTPRNSALSSVSYFVPADQKWTDVFGHVYQNLYGDNSDKENRFSLNTCQIWENLVSTLHRLRKLFDSQIYFKNVKNSTDGLDTIPDWNRPFDESYYRMVKDYCLLALQKSYHPFGRLLIGLTDVFNASYSGVGAHPALLPQAIAEISSVIRRFYELIRLLFPNLPHENDMDKLLVEASSNIYNKQNDFETCSSFLYDCFLQQVYPTLFTLYVMQNDSIDGKFASRIKTLNARNDVALLDAFNVDKHLWPIRLSDSIRDSNVLDTPMICVTARSKYYADAIECLQRLSSEFYPSAKLKVIVETFYHINECVSQFSSEPSNHLWSADSLVPVTMYVVVRAQIQRLGAEIRLIEDFSPQLQYLGQVQYLLATLQGCYKHVVEDKNLF